MTSYLAPLAAVGAVAGFIGSMLFRAALPFGASVTGGFVGGLIGACVSFVMTIVGCFIIGFIINALAPTFGGRQDSNQAFKTAVYSYTPGLVAAVLADSSAPRVARRHHRRRCTGSTCSTSVCR